MTNFFNLMDQKYRASNPPKNYSITKVKENLENQYDRLFEAKTEDKNSEYIYNTFESPYFSNSTIKSKRKIRIQAEIESLDDLIQMIDDNPITSNVEYEIDMEPLYKIKPDLIKLNRMVGMKSLKNNVVDQILYFSQKFMNDSDGDFMHTVIYGPPGTGKTEIAKIIGKIYSRLGVLHKNKFKKATRSDMIAGYLGQTAIKTRDLIKECLGGVLFIDEAYALGNAEGRDSFSKEAIDTLCEALSDHKDNLMVIIAGYEQELKNCFFNYNKGLESRFTWRFKTDDYNANELRQIFEKKVVDAGWKLKESAGDDWFEENLDYFKYYGRDMETLFCKTKIAHSRRVFCLPQEDKQKITKADLDKGLEAYLANDEVRNRKERVENFGNIYS